MAFTRRRLSQHAKYFSRCYGRVGPRRCIQAAFSQEACVGHQKPDSVAVLWVESALNDGKSPLLKLVATNQIYHQIQPLLPPPTTNNKSEEVSTTLKQSRRRSLPSLRRQRMVKLMAAETATPRILPNSVMDGGPSFIKKQTDSAEPLTRTTRHSMGSWWTTWL